MGSCLSVKNTTGQLNECSHDTISSETMNETNETTNDVTVKNNETNNLMVNISKALSCDNNSNASKIFENIIEDSSELKCPIHKIKCPLSCSPISITITDDSDIDYNFPSRTPSTSFTNEENYCPIHLNEICDCKTLTLKPLNITTPVSKRLNKQCFIFTIDENIIKF